MRNLTVARGRRTVRVCQRLASATNDDNNYAIGNAMHLDYQPPLPFEVTLIN